MPGKEDMFSRKRCKKCGKWLSGDYAYCPYCGVKLYDERDYGLLGKNDEVEMFETSERISDTFDFFGLPGFDRLFKRLFIELEKQFRELDKQFRERPEARGGISISISSIDDKPIIKVKTGGDFGKKPRKGRQKMKSSAHVEEELAKKLAKLPREEPSSSVRRLGSKVVYEIDLPGVKSLRDVIVNKLENSIEIKAVGKDKAYFKLIPIDLPIKRYMLRNGKLVLELEAL